MKRTPRYILNTLTVVSLVLSMAAVISSANGYWHLQQIAYNTPNSHFGIESWHGHFGLYLVNEKFGDEGWYFNHSPIKEISPLEDTNLDWYYLGFGMAWNKSDPSFANPIYEFVTPFWLLTLILAVLPAIWLLKWNKRRKLGPNACPACGYDLTGNESGKCPECGASKELPAETG